MKNKFVYLLSFVVATFLFLSSTVFATDIDMNLQPNNNSTGYSSQENSIDDEDDYDNTLNNSVQSNNSVGTDNSIDQSTTVKSVSSVAEESFGLSQILNILLIVVGVVLILLAIAILIRLNS